MKKMLALIAVTCLVCVLTACGQSNQSSQSQQSGQSEQNGQSQQSGQSEQAAQDEQDAYDQLVREAQEASKTREVTVDDQESYEAVAHAWMEAWFEMYKALPEDNMAHLAAGEVDDLEVRMVAKEGLPRAVRFSTNFSVQPTYPIGRNAFWMPGNTGSNPDRDETWGQMYREVELRMEDDGRFHFVSMGSGGLYGTGQPRYEEFEEYPAPGS